MINLLRLSSLLLMLLFHDHAAEALVPRSEKEPTAGSAIRR